MNIKCTQNIFPSTNGLSHVSYYILCPEDTAPRAVVQLCHGMCEYFSRYTAFAKYLCSLGFIVCGHDHIGHGSSAPKDSDLGFFAARDGWRYLIDDTGQLTHLMQTRYPDLPYFLFGHSMGSLIARLYLKDYGQAQTGCILSGTAGPNPTARAGIRLADSIAHTKGVTFRSPFLYALAMGTYNRRIKAPKTLFDWICRDEQVVSLFAADEKCNFLFTASAFRDLFTLTYRANNSHCFRATPHDLPLLLIAGDQDPVGKYGEGVRQVANMYKAVGQTDVEVIFYKDCRHEILHEANRLDVFADISRWLEARLPAPKA
jgi:alpha-beta hydrolase superfamily lysophospholipase